MRMNWHLSDFAWCVLSKALIVCLALLIGSLVALLECIRGVRCSLNVGTAQKERYSLHTAGLTLAGSVGCPFPLPPWAELWEISRKVSWKGMDSQGEGLPCYEAICAAENSTDMGCLFSRYHPPPPPRPLTTSDTQFLS